MNSNSAVLEAEPAIVDATTGNGTGSSPSGVKGWEIGGSFERTPVTFGYKAGLVVVALGMALLLAVYAGLIVTAALGVYYHLKVNSLLMEHSTNYATVFVYLWPAAAGAVLVFFMIKPIFAGKPEQPPKYSLTPQSDPELFAFIERICGLVKAPLPSRVDVDCDINASAGFRRGLLSMRGNDVVLTIGLPLVAGLTMQEFAGVLAHEFGHFAQGAGMKLTYVIRATSGWFARVVYERDEWDVRLARAAYSVDLRVGVFLHLIRFAVWLSRRSLWLLMYLGQAFSCFMLRQMEYDADTYEAKVAGSEAFARTSTKLHDLNVAGLWASRKINESWRNRRLPQNLPSYIAVSVKNVPADLRKELEERATKKRLKILDTHPSDADRVRAAISLNERGVFQSDEPASALFKDFSELSGAATRFHYEHNLQLRITDANLVAHEVSEHESQSQADGEAGLRDFFLGLKLSYRPILISEELPAPLPTAQLVETLRQARQAMESSKADAQKALAGYQEAEVLYQRGYEAVRQQSQQATARAEETMQSFAPVLTAFEQHAQTRLNCATQLLVDPAFPAKFQEHAALQSEAKQLRVVFARLGQAFGPLQELRRKYGALSAAIGACTEERRRSSRLEAAEQRIDELVPEIKKLINEIRAVIQETPYPFHHAREDLTLEEFARNDVPAMGKLEALCNNCTCHLSRLLPLYYRVLGRLAFITLKVEEQA